MIMAMEKVDGETSAECRERCSQSCAMTEALPAKCLQSCYRRCQGLPSHTIGNYFFMFILTKKNKTKKFYKNAKTNVEFMIIVMFYKL